MNDIVFTPADVGRRLRVLDVVHDDTYDGTIEQYVTGEYCFIWDVTNLPLGIMERDELEWLD